MMPVVLADVVGVDGGNVREKSLLVVGGVFVVSLFGFVGWRSFGS